MNEILIEHFKDMIEALSRKTAREAAGWRCEIRENVKASRYVCDGCPGVGAPNAGFISVNGGSAALLISERPF